MRTSTCTTSSISGPTNGDRREATGNVVFVRYADDIVAGFEHEADGKRFWDAMRMRLEQFSLELHGEKTRLLEFGRHAAARRQKKGLGKPETFKFLGFRFICGRSGEEHSSFSERPERTGWDQGSETSRRSCVTACTTPFPNRGDG